MPSMKVMPSVELEPDWTTSPLLTLSPWFRMIETPLRIAVALPVSLVTWPMTCGATLGAAVGLRELGVTGQRVDDVAGEMGAIGRGQRRALLALEVVVQDQFAVVAGQDEVDARALEVAVEEQIGVRNDNGVRRRMRRNAVDVDRTMGVRTMDARQHVSKFAGQTQNGTVAAKVNIYTIFEGLNLHITGWLARNHPLLVQVA